MAGIQSTPAFFKVDAELIIASGMQEYVILQNSWGTDRGDYGYYYYGLSNPNTPEFSDPNFNSACNLNKFVVAYN